MVKAWLRLASENRDLPGWMRVGELIAYTAAFYPKWDADFTEKLRRQLDLDPMAKVNSLSLGQKAKAALLIAQGHRPDLLVLDEPSASLDPVVRRDILEAIIRIAAEEGRTIFFSSHLLDEIERVSHRIAMIRQGKILFCGRLEEIQSQHRRWRLRLSNPQNTAPRVPGAFSVTGAGQDWRVITNSMEPPTASADGMQWFEEGRPSLEEIFVARACGEQCLPTAN